MPVRAFDVHDDGQLAEQRLRQRQVRSGREKGANLVKEALLIFDFSASRRACPGSPTLHHQTPSPQQRRLSLAYSASDSRRSRLCVY